MNGIPDWPEIAISDNYRTATPSQQAAMKMAWLRDTMPKLYPQAVSNPLLRGAILQGVNTFNVPGKLPDEDAIVTPSTISANNFVSLERNPLYIKKSYAEQQQLKSVWYAKTSVLDPEMRKMPIDKQQQFYSNLMRRGPALTTGLIPGYSPEEIQKGFDASSRAMQVTRTVMANLSTSLGEGLTSIVTGPARLLMGDKSIIANIMDDVEKHRDWINAVSENNDFLTKTLPSLLGTGLSFAIGPWGKVGQAMSGGVKLEKGAASAAKMIGIVPGLLEKAGGRLGAKLPSLAYQAGGEAMTGAAWGIADNLSKGKTWHEGLAANVGMAGTIGFATRYLGMFKALRGAAREMGIDPRHATEIFREPLEIGAGKILSKEHEAIIKLHPEYRDIIFNLHSVDKNGFLAKNIYTPQGVEMVANLQGFKTRQTGDVLDIMKGDKIVKSIQHGDESVRIDKAMGWMDAQPSVETWQKSLGKKQFTEMLMTAPSLYARQITFIPEKARAHIADFMNQHGVPGFDYRLNPDRAGVFQVDDVFDILRSQKSYPKLAAALSSRGVVFDVNPVINRATVKQLQYELDQIIPKGAYLVIDKAHPANTRMALPGVDPEAAKRPMPNLNIEHADVPLYFLEAPDKYEPSINNKLFVGSPGQIRNQFALDAKYKKSVDIQLGRRAHGLGLSYRKFLDTQVVEFQIPIEDAQGNKAFVRLHAPSMKDAVELISRGRIKDKSAFAGHFFGDNKLLQKKYDDYLKVIKKSKGQEWVDKNWMPFQYTAAQAKQNDYYLGLYKGKYVLQDLLDPKPGFRTFNSIGETIDWLNSNESRLGRPDLMNGLSPDAVESMYPGLKDALTEVGPVEIGDGKKYGLLYGVQAKVMPTPWMMDRFSKLEAVKQSGADPVGIINKLNDMTGMVNDFTTVRDRHVEGIIKGMNKTESSVMKRWIESLDSDTEIRSGNLYYDDVMYEMKSNVESEMATTFGKQRADELIKKGVDLQRYYTDLFSLSGEDWTKFVKHYFPHARAETAKYGGGLSNHLSNKVLRGVPSADRSFFFEFMREVDPKDMSFSEDIGGVTKMYTHLMARKLFTRPIAKNIGDQIRTINTAYNTMGITPKDYIAFEDYVVGVMSSIENISSPSDRMLRIATDNMMENISGKLSALTGGKVPVSSGKHSAISRLATIAAGGQIAGRPYPIFRNFTQSLVTGAPVIGIKGYLNGLEEAMKPGAMVRMEKLGLIAPQNIPLTTGKDIGTGLFGRMVTKAMKPYKWVDDFNRTVIYHGAESNARQAVADLAAGRINANQFKVQSGANLWGKAEMNYALGLFSKNGDPAAFIHQVSKISMERTQYLYETFNQPSMFRSSLGRLAGQYTSWPINFASMVMSRLTSDSLTVGQRISFFAELGVITGSIAAGLSSVGLSPRQWAPWNMMLLQGGPYYQLVNDVFGFLNGSQEGLRGIANLMTSLVPFGLEGQGVMQAYQAMQDGDWWEAAAHLMSAPLMTDQYPRRETPGDIVSKTIIAAGQKYLKAQGFMK